MKASLNRKQAFQWMGQASALVVLATAAACGQNPALTRPQTPSSSGGSQQTAQQSPGAAENHGEGSSGSSSVADSASSRSSGSPSAASSSGTVPGSSGSSAAPGSVLPGAMAGNSSGSSGANQDASASQGQIGASSSPTSDPHASAPNAVAGNGAVADSGSSRSSGSPSAASSSGTVPGSSGSSAAPGSVLPGAMAGNSSGSGANQDASASQGSQVGAPAASNPASSNPSASGAVASSDLPTPQQIAQPAPLNPPTVQPKLATPTCPECTETKPFRFEVRALTKDEIAYNIGNNLPYMSFPKRNFGKRDKLGGGESARNDTQVMMAIDITQLPPRESITGVENAILSLELRISGHNKTLNNQLLCFPEYHLCSGGVIDLERYPQFRNSFNLPFFAERKGPVNRYFSEYPVDLKVGKWSGTGIVKLELSDLIAGTELDVLKLLYGPNSGTKWITPATHQTLYVVAAEDIGVLKNKRAYLEVTLNYDKKLASAMDPSPVLEAPKSQRK